MALCFRSSLLISSAASAVGITSIALFNGTNGANPRGSLTYNSSTGLYYISTNIEGTDNFSTIHSVNTTGNLTKLALLNGTNGNYPYGSLTLGSNGLFYGTTIQGGASGNGNIFSFDPSNVSAVPESLNIPGAGIALSLGALVKRKVKG